MQAILSLQRKIAPELSGLLEMRYNLLRQIALNQPVGRRLLAAKAGLSERVLRAQVDFLKDAGLLEFSHLGMNITDEGGYLLDKLEAYVREVNGIVALEHELSQVLPVEKVVVVPGDSEQSEMSFHDLGYTGAGILKTCMNVVTDTPNIAISGGTTMRMLAESVNYSCANALVLPARGGLGDDAKQQANSIAAFLAGKLGASYRQLYMPDNLSEKTLEALLAEDDDLRKVLNLMRYTDVMVHGIGMAARMAERRGAESGDLFKLREAGAVGEALGKYFTLEGKQVCLDKKAAVLLNDFSGISTVMAVAGGESKAEAILSVCRSGNIHILVTDFAAANKMMKKF